MLREIARSIHAWALIRHLYAPSPPVWTLGHEGYRLFDEPDGVEKAASQFASSTPSQGDKLVEEGCGAARGCAAGDEGDGPLRHRVVSREVLDGLVGSDVDEEGVDLDEFARPDRLHALGQALSVALAHDAQAAWTGFATKHRHGRDDASRHELRQDAPDHRDRDVDPLAAQEDSELALAPHRMISAQPLDLAHESAGPSRLTLPVRPSRARLEPLLPTVERGPARPDGAGRLLGRKPARAGAPPAFERVSPDGCEL